MPLTVVAPNAEDREDTPAISISPTERSGTETPEAAPTVTEAPTHAPSTSSPSSIRREVGATFSGASITLRTCYARSAPTISDKEHNSRRHICYQPLVTRDSKQCMRAPSPGPMPSSCPVRYPSANITGEYRGCCSRSCIYRRRRGRCCHVRRKHG